MTPEQDSSDSVVINGLTYVPLDSVARYEKRKEGPWQIGEQYFIRTVTMALAGLLVDVTPQELVLVNAAWIADTGRFSNFVNGTDAEEIEPFPKKEVIIGRNAIIDAVRRDGDYSKQK